MVWMEKAERRTRLSRSLLLATPICALLVALSSCSEERIIGTAVVPSEGGTFSPLAPIDASASEAEAELISYCPSNKCPPGWTTCPDSRFPCDTNILASPANCGGCGMACPPNAGGSTFTCNEGACVLQCQAALNVKDCDGLIDNGCESRDLDPMNCGACGVVCPAGVNCRYQDAARSMIGCGCPTGMVDCAGCRDLSANDANCGTCQNACDRTGGPDAPQYSNMYYGCLAGQCGKPKCEAGFANCDGELDNGCETSILADDHCGACNNKCPSGQSCAIDARTNQPTCVCGPGLTFCQTGEVQGVPKGHCTDLRSSMDDCGACGVSCAATGAGNNRMPMCDFGKCLLTCLNGTMDCNGAESDGCEVDTKIDPRNCGGCGITCDLALGQACVAGKCVVEPCDEADAGEVTR
jgi:hypothetical protein